MSIKPDKSFSVGLEPIKVVTVDDIAWDDEADVIVVGLGGAGVICAIEALENGAEVLAIDRFEGGGATAYSGGVIYAGGTQIQREAGIDDDPVEMAKYLAMEVGDAVSGETLVKFCKDSGQNLDWLVKHGVPYDSTLYEEKTVFPPDGAFLYYSGNERVNAYAAKAKPAPRGHRAVTKGFNSGRVFYEALRASADGLGLRIRTHSVVTRFIQDTSGRVVGVECQEVNPEDRVEHKRIYDRVQPLKPFNGETAQKAAMDSREIELRGRIRRVRARRGVVVTTGGYAYNIDLLNQHIPLMGKNFRALLRMGSLGCDGSSVYLGQSIGARLRGLNRAYVGRNLAPPNAYLRGMLINQEGHRFVDEMAYVGSVGQALLHQPEGRAWLIMNSKDFWLSIRQAFTGNSLFIKYFGLPALLNVLVGGTQRSRTIEGLARKCGIDPDSLIHEINSYNVSIGLGQEDKFCKDDKNRKRIDSPCYYAVNFSIPNKYAFTQFYPLGGMVVDERSGAVLRADGVAIEGLFAAGRAAFGFPCNNSISGLSLADCVYSGRRAARSVVAAD